MGKSSIYYLADSITNKPFYVGQTTKDLSDRLSHHISTAKSNARDTALRSLKIRTILDLGAEVLIVEICKCDFEDGERIEKEWINRLNDWGFSIVNIRTNESLFSTTPLERKEPGVISTNIKSLRASLNLTQEGFSEKLKIKRSRLAAYEEGRCEPKYNLLLAFAELACCTADDFMTKDMRSKVLNKIA